MLRFLSFLVICVSVRLGHGQMACPGNAELRIMQCSQQLQGYAQATSPSDRLQHCGDARRGLACMRGVIRGCQGIQGTPLGEMINSFDHLEEQLNTVCSSSPPMQTVRPSSNANRCTRGAQRKLQRCSNNMQRYVSESRIICSKVERAIDCMIRQSQRCPAIIEAGTVTRIQSLRQNIMQICVEDEDEDVNETEVPGGQEVVCPANYISRLPQCAGDLSQQMSTMMGSGRPSDEQCRQINENFDCVTDIVTGCANEAGVTAMSSQLHLDQLRDILGGLCPAVGEETDIELEGQGPVGGTQTNTEIQTEGDAGCPAGHMSRLLSCVEPMQGLGAGQNMAEMCSIMNTGFTCIQDIITKCPDQPDVEAMANAMDLDSIRSMVQTQCP